MCLSQTIDFLYGTLRRVMMGLGDYRGLEVPSLLQSVVLCLSIALLGTTGLKRFAAIQHSY